MFCCLSKKPFNANICLKNTSPLHPGSPGRGCVCVDPRLVCETALAPDFLFTKARFTRTFGLSGCGDSEDDAWNGSVSAAHFSGQN